MNIHRSHEVTLFFGTHRTLRGTDEQVTKAAKAVAGLAPMKWDRFIALDGAAKRSCPALRGHIPVSPVSSNQNQQEPASFRNLS
jgi:hypothetical protein